MTHSSDSRIPFTEARDDVEILWGYPAAAMIEAGGAASHHPAGHRVAPLPTVAEIDEHIYGRTPAPEITEGIIYAANVFRENVRRYPTPAEVLAGLLLVDVELALLTYVANEIRVGDVGRA